MVHTEREKEIGSWPTSTGRTHATTEKNHKTHLPVRALHIKHIDEKGDVAEDGLLLVKVLLQKGGLSTHKEDTREAT
jgi:hypothetical protein